MSKVTIALPKSADRDSINRAIEAAPEAGGGAVQLPAGTYLTGSMNVTIRNWNRLPDRRVERADRKET